VLAAAAKRGLTGRRATIVLDGGELQIEWTAGNRLMMTGPAAESFSGVLPPELAPVGQ
jgi:diaminopimelate epimerase